MTESFFYRCIQGFIIPLRAEINAKEVLAEQKITELEIAIFGQNL